MRKSGFTLVELIVSLAVLGILAVSMSMVVGGNLNFLRITKDISEETYLSQKNVELDMSKIKRDLKETGHGLTLNQVTIDGVVVDYYLATKSLHNATFKYMVTPIQLPEYVLLQTFDVKATLKNGANDAYVSYPLAVNSVIGTNRPDPATYSAHWMMDIQQWYVSKEGFYTPYPRGNTYTAIFDSFSYLSSVSKDSEIGKRYPKFPDDYVLIGAETTPTMLDLSRFAGRHLVYSVTPAAKSGRIGLPEFSEPIYISGLSETNNLSVHLDASYLDPSNSNELSGDNVSRWPDLSSGVTSATPSQSANYSGTRPKLVDSDMEKEFLGRFVKFSPSSSMTLGGNPTDRQYRYVYAVARGRNNPRIIRDGTGNDTVMSVYDTSFSNGWKLVSHQYRSASQDITIGGTDSEIAEIIVYAYNTELTLPEREALTSKVTLYLNKKYKATDSLAPIAYLYPIDMEVRVGQTAELPYSILAKMSDGTDQYVNVTWDDNSSLDTSREGLIVRTGRSTIDPSKLVIFRLRVSSVLVTSVKITPMNTPLELNKTFTLSYEVLPSNATDRLVNWRSSDESVVTVSNGQLNGIGVGTATIRATSNANSSIFDEILVTVKTREQMVRDELKAYLASETIWIDWERIDMKDYLKVKSIEGVKLSMVSMVRESGNIGLTLNAEGSQASVLRLPESTDTVYKLTLEAEKENFKEQIVYKVMISQNFTLPITITK